MNSLNNAEFRTRLLVRMLRIFPNPLHSQVSAEKSESGKAVFAGENQIVSSSS
jgi:hypothetical protein